MTAEAEWQRLALDAAASSKMANQRMDDHMRECSERYKQLVVAQTDMRKGLDSMKMLLLSAVGTFALGCIGVIVTLLQVHLH